MTNVINEEAARAILAAGGFPDPAPCDALDTAGRLDEIARALITDHYLNRLDDKGRLRSLPRPAARQRLYGDLEGVWTDLPGIRRLPTVVYSRDKEYRGGFVRFVQAFAGAMADHLQPHAGEPLWGGLIGTLRRLQRGGGGGTNPVSAAFRRHANKEVPLSDIQAVIFGIVQDGHSRADEIAAILHKPVDEVQAVLIQLVKLGRIKPSA